MVASGVLPLADAYTAIDIDTITLLLGMMIIVANLRLAGFFAVITNWVMQHLHRPRDHSRINRYERQRHVAY